MAFPISKAVLPPTNNIARGLDEIYKDLHELDFIAIEGRPKGALEKKESLQKEKQISVDPESLRESSMGEISFNMMLPPIETPPHDNVVPFPPPLLPAKHKFLSCSTSLPNSATSSPRFSSILSRKNLLRNESQASPRLVDKLVNKHLSISPYDQKLLKISNKFLRSKSCGEGRTCAPPDDFYDLWLSQANNTLEYKNKNHNQGPHSNLISNNVNINSDINCRKSSKTMESNEDDFKCSALCLFLPGFGKAKPVRSPRKDEAKMAMMKKNSMISRTVSLEKFECGSWASSSIIPDHDDDGDSMSLFFDLPLELIKNLGNDAHLPVSAAFVFDKDIKGVLKNGSTSSRATATGRKSHESSRHVRFSTSSPTSYPASPASCITPRLRKAREDFNAFLEAQSA